MFRFCVVGLMVSASLLGCGDGVSDSSSGHDAMRADAPLAGDGRDRPDGASPSDQRTVDAATAPDIATRDAAPEELSAAPVDTGDGPDSAIDIAPAVPDLAIDIALAVPDANPPDAQSIDSPAADTAVEAPSADERFADSPPLGMLDSAGGPDTFLPPPSLDTAHAPDSFATPPDWPLVDLATVADGSMASDDSPAEATEAGQPDACSSESSFALCARLGSDCGTLTAVDGCGRTRQIFCGGCPQGFACTEKNRCVCLPEDDGGFCTRMGVACGPASGTDNCGWARSVADCGGCDDGNGCTTDGCVAGACRHMDTRACGQACQASSNCTVVDTDGDGLNDVWESNGYVDLDCNGRFDEGTDTPLPGADIKKPNLYVKWDYMNLSDGPWPHSHKPPDISMSWAQEVLAKYNVILGYYPDHDLLTEHDVVSASPANAIPSCAGSDAISFYTIKAAHFPDRLAPAYHYGVFAHNNTCGGWDECTSCPTNTHTTEVPSWMTYEATGIAVMPGRDFIVSFGSLDDGGIVIPDLWFTGVFLHQLGHNAGLHNGGGDDFDYKPNYISLMNGSYQRGISRTSPWNPQTPWSASAYDPAGGYALDFSAFTAATLHEGVADSHGACVDDGSGGLDETVGVATPEGYPSTAVRFTGPDLGNYFGPAGGHPIDWNVDYNPGARHLFRDLSGDGKCSDLVGYNDMELAAAGEGVTKLAHWQPNAACAAGYWTNGVSPP